MLRVISCRDLLVGILLGAVVGTLIHAAGCAAKPSPELIAARAVTILALIEVAQDSIIAAEADGLISEDHAATGLSHIARGMLLVRMLRPTLEGWDQLSGDARREQLEDAYILVWTLSQVLAGVTLPGGQMAPVHDALLGVNGLLLRISDLRED